MKFYTRKTPRHPRYDYTLPGAYFITICTKHMAHYFGKIRDGKMKLNALGTYTTKHRSHISDHYPFVIPKTFICMPNHIHGIIIIKNNPKPVGTQFLASSKNHHNTFHNHYVTNKYQGNIDPGNIKNVGNVYASNVKRTYKNTSLPNNISKKIGKINNISAKSGSLGSIIRGFKIGVTKFAKQQNIPFERQSRYHDAIINNETSYTRIKYYIINNPKKRNKDRFR